jgi:putative ATP-binding cassette transporter
VHSYLRGIRRARNFIAAHFARSGEQVLASYSSGVICLNYFEARAVSESSIQNTGEGVSRGSSPLNREADSAGKLVSRFWASASGFWRGPGSYSAWLLTGLLVATIFLQLTIQYRLNFWSRDFFDAFGRRDGLGLKAEALIFIPLAGSSVLVAALAVWARMTTQRRWRAWLTEHIIDYWLANDKFRQLRFPAGEDQNPEYRIAEDARVATEAPIGMSSGLLAAVLNAVVFIDILWNVGGDLVVDISGYVLTVPKYLVISVGVYSTVLSITVTIIDRRLIRVFAAKNAAEAQFRSVGSHLRERGHSTAASTGAIEQRALLNSALHEVIDRSRSLCLQFVRTTLVSQGNVLLAPVVAWVLCAPKYLDGAMSLGDVAQATAAFITVQTALNWLVDNYPAVADCLSSVNRVASLLVALDEFDHNHRHQSFRHGKADGMTASEAFTKPQQKS